MDPEDCLDRIEGAGVDDDLEEAVYACRDLLDWLKVGAFPPRLTRNRLIVLLHVVEMLDEERHLKD